MTGDQPKRNQEEPDDEAPLDYVMWSGIVGCLVCLCLFWGSSVFFEVPYDPMDPYFDLLIGTLSFTVLVIGVVFWQLHSFSCIRSSGNSGRFLTIAVGIMLGLAGEIILGYQGLYLLAGLIYSVAFILGRAVFSANRT